MLPSWRGRGADCVDQVANAKDSTVDLTPVSDAPAEATRAGWAALLTGQAVPVIGERGAYDAEPGDDC